MSCVVKGCFSHSSRSKRRQENGILTFHRFPLDSRLRKKWIERVGRQEWTCSKNSRICSKHFTSDLFKDETARPRRLNREAVPNVNLPGISKVAAPSEDKEETSVTPCSTPERFIPDIKQEVEDDKCEETLRNEHRSQKPTKRSPKSLRKRNSNGKTMINRFLHFVQLQVPSTTNEDEPGYIASDAGYMCEVKVEIEHSDDEGGSPRRTTRNTCDNYVCNKKELDYQHQINILHKKLEHLEKLSQQRKVKINAQAKEISKLEKRNTDLFKTLMVKMGKQTEIGYVFNVKTNVGIK